MYVRTLIQARGSLRVRKFGIFIYEEIHNLTDTLQLNRNVKENVELI